MPLLYNEIYPAAFIQLFSGFFYILHFLILFPLVTLSGIWSIYRQAREIYAVPFPSALSLQGLAVQAVVFSIVAVMWIFALPFPYDQGHFGWKVLLEWYRAVGWLILDTLLYALGRLVLLAVALRRGESASGSVGQSQPEDDGEGQGETEPLLGHGEE